ncbi:dynamin family protein [Acidipila sp. EB88]|uniref:dynamin family protein n=1 Tax=Acidipila sp. EB88 TaxID=2305226 RepID=UPI000F5F302B|nr:dynamin family protein [Acidipila sp. EB88]RRA50433.1 hypothetical protein D1Y84_00005 [Acidipila sp. EB88]
MENLVPATATHISRALRHAADRLGELPELRETADLIRSAADDVLLPPLVVVLGAFNAGKSTLLNALLQRPLLAMHVLPSTAVVTLLRAPRLGKPAIQAFKEGRHAWFGDMDSLSQISAEGDSSLAPLRESWSHIEVGVDAAILERATLVDTPGLNSIIESHTLGTQRFLKRARVAVWVTSALQPMSKSDLEQIQRLPERCKLLIALNQTDELDPDEDPIEAICQRVDRLISRPKQVVPISAKMALESFRASDQDMLRRSNRGALLAALEGQLADLVDGNADGYAIYVAFEEWRKVLKASAAKRLVIVRELDSLNTRNGALESEFALLRSAAERFSGTGNAVAAVLLAKDCFFEHLPIEIRSTLKEAADSTLSIVSLEEEMRFKWDSWELRQSHSMSSELACMRPRLNTKTPASSAPNLFYLRAKGRSWIERGGSSINAVVSWNGTSVLFGRSNRA